MAFLATILQTLVKMIIVGVFAFGGIQYGRHLRKKKDSKNAKDKLEA